MVREIGKKLLKKRNYAIAITLDNFDKMNGVENFLWNINNLMENFPRVGLILISTSEAEIRGLVGRRLFSRLRPEYCEFPQRVKAGVFISHDFGAVVLKLRRVKFKL
jgi:hypothetical protein